MTSASGYFFRHRARLPVSVLGKLSWGGQLFDESRLASLGTTF